MGGGRQGPGVGHLSAGGQGWSCGHQEEACLEQGARTGVAERRRGALVHPQGHWPCTPIHTYCHARTGGRAREDIAAPPPSL